MSRHREFAQTAESVPRDREDRISRLRLSGDDGPPPTGANVGARWYLGEGGLTAQKSCLERARCIDGMLPGEGRVRRCRGALTKPRQRDLTARLLGDRRRFSGR